MYRKDNWHKVRITNYEIVHLQRGFLVDDYLLDAVVVSWLEDNAKEPWSFDWMNGDYVSFKEERDAMLFKLTWGGA